ncbi:MAG: RagB/SusD family nutrient uptake outer membrane protein [Gemmatimonadaceae bacterium]
MMKKIRSAVTRTATATALVVAAVACSDKFVEVTNPNVIDAATVDPTSGATTLALSAQQNYATALGLLATYGGWFTEEANVADTFPTRNEFGFRLISDLNGSLNTEVWQPISLAAASAKAVLDLDLPSPANNINVARAATFRGFSILQIATDFCTTALSSGPELTSAQALDSAIFWFSKGVEVGNANGTADGKALANASLVGRARAKLQKGDKAGAAADAAAVSAGFVFNLNMTDDLSNRGRLSNRQYQFTFDRSSISVAPWFRTGDPRVPYIAPGQPGALNGQDAVPGGFYRQTKFNGYATPLRLASKLEADYIAAEAGDATAQLALIAARRTANGLSAYAGATDAASVLAELYNQRAYEFYLEGKRVADFRRSPASVTNMTPAGGVYFKPGYANVGADKCYPLPRAERDNNPNMKTP